MTLRGNYDSNKEKYRTIKALETRKIKRGTTASLYFPVVISVPDFGLFFIFFTGIVVVLSALVVTCVDVKWQDV